VKKRSQNRAEKWKIKKGPEKVRKFFRAERGGEKRKKTKALDLGRIGLKKAIKGRI